MRRRCWDSPCPQIIIILRLKKKYIDKIRSCLKTEAEEAVVFFDALDSLDYFEDEDDAGMNRKSKKSLTDPRIVDLQSKLSKINRRKACIRSSKVTNVTIWIYENCKTLCVSFKNQIVCDRCISPNLIQICV